jgi:hypothetical protein
MDRTGPCRPIGVRPPGGNGGTDSIFSSLDRLGPSRLDRAGPWTRPARTVCKTLDTSILSVRCYNDIFHKYKNSYFQVKNKEIK